MTVLPAVRQAEPAPCTCGGQWPGNTPATPLNVTAWRLIHRGRGHRPTDYATAKATRLRKGEKA